MEPKSLILKVNIAAVIDVFEHLPTNNVYCVRYI